MTGERQFEECNKAAILLRVIGTAKELVNIGSLKVRAALKHNTHAFRGHGR
jgi:hypothetical protein